MSRFADNVHLTDPKDHTSVFFMKGELIPEWAFAMIGDHLIREGEGDPVKPDVSKIAESVSKTAMKLAEVLEKTTEEDLGLDEDDDDETAKTVPADEDEDDDDDKPYDEWTNQELRDELISRSLATGGKKEELVARLEEDDA